MEDSQIGGGGGGWVNKRAYYALCDDTLKTSVLFETLRPNWLFSEPTLPQKRITTWFYPIIYSLLLLFTTCKASNIT